MQADVRRITADVALVRAVGDVDLDNAGRLHEALVAALETGTERLVVDLRGVTHFDSSALGVVVLLMKRLRGNGGELALVCDGAEVRRPFEVTGLDRSIRLFESVAAAVEYVRGSSRLREQAR